MDMRVSDSVPMALTLLASGCFWPYPAVCADLLNPGDLSLRVATTEITNDPTLCASPEGVNALFAEHGSKLVKVILQGRVIRAGRVILPDAAFTAVFDKLDGNTKDAVPPAAMCVNGGLLILSSATNFRQYMVTPGLISITLIFGVPEEVNLFQVTYPALVAGVASLGTRTAAMR